MYVQIMCVFYLELCVAESVLLKSHCGICIIVITCGRRHTIFKRGAYVTVCRVICMSALKCKWLNCVLSLNGCGLYVWIVVHDVCVWLCTMSVYGCALWVNGCVLCEWMCTICMWMYFILIYLSCTQNVFILSPDAQEHTSFETMKSVQLDLLATRSMILLVVLR